MNAEVVVYSKNNEYLKHSYLLKNENINLLGVAKDFSKVKAYLVLHKKIVIFIDENTVSEDLEEVLKYISTKECGAVFCSQKNMMNNSYSKHVNLEYIYKNQYLNIEQFAKVCCQKINKLYKNINSSEKNDNTCRTDNKVNTTIENKKHSYIDNLKEEKNQYSSKANNTKFSKIIVIGASTGGPDTILKVLKPFSKQFDLPILIVQHMPEHFTKMFARRMDNECNIKVVEPKNGDQIFGGVAYVAPGGLQMEIEYRNSGYFIKISPPSNEYVNNPSVDVLFNSVVRVWKKSIIAVILTGMGKDGAKGMLEIKRMGGYTIGQDAQTCVVYGMPKAAYDIGAIKKQLPVDRITPYILEKLL